MLLDLPLKEVLVGGAFDVLRAYCFRPIGDSHDLREIIAVTRQ
jgi:hypothetical protein